ncbi:uncharacterized protein FFB20_05505 [Fusarium fujikuroi]|nr:uncharacterized protein FFB20_05505 [Fusarium fujikuroi]SCO24820.1 uncharacterized protein FFC1_15211 [Fusarium fujikuroi]SCV59978.1 uncharacterized protein FFFS_14547 [Fusarium fujikuroi]
MYWAHGVAGDKKVMHGWQGVGAGTTQVELPDHGVAGWKEDCFNDAGGRNPGLASVSHRRQPMIAR